MFHQYGIENCAIALITEYAVTNREQQFMYERKHYDELKHLLVNKVKPYISPEEKRQYVAKYNQENKEYIDTRTKIYQQENQEHLNQYLAQYNQDNKERMAAIKKKYNQENKEHLAAKQKKYQQDNKEHIMEYKENTNRQINTKPIFVNNAVNSANINNGQNI